MIRFATVPSRFTVRNGLLEEIEDYFLPHGAWLETGGMQEYVAALVEIPPSGLALRVLAWLALPFRIAARERAMMRDGATVLGRFALVPSIESPTLIYQLRTPASKYAETRLLPTAGRMPFRRLRTTLSAWIGCDPAVGGVVIIGKMP